MVGRLNHCSTVCTQGKLNSWVSLQRQACVSERMYPFTSMVLNNVLFFYKLAYVLRILYYSSILRCHATMCSYTMYNVLLLLLFFPFKLAHSSPVNCNKKKQFLLIVQTPFINTFQYLFCFQ